LPIWTAPGGVSNSISIISIYRQLVAQARYQNSVQDRRLCVRATTPDVSAHRSLQGAGRVGDDRGTGFLAHSGLAVLPSGETLGLAHQTIWARQTRGSAVWAQTVATIGRPPAGTRFVLVADRGADVFEPLESVRETGWDAIVRAAQDRRLAAGGGSLTARRARWARPPS
jgi:hypothetical protein